MKCRTSREVNWIRSDKQIIGISCRINVKIWHNTSHAACKSRSWLSISLLLRERVNNSSRERERISCYERIWRIFFFTFSWKKALWFITCLFSRARRAVHVPGWMNSTRCVVQEGGKLCTYCNWKVSCDLLTWIYRGFVRDQLVAYDADISVGTMWLKLHIGIAFYFYYNHQNL